MDLTRWESEMDRMMDEFFGRRLRPCWPSLLSRGADGGLTAPAVDVYEEKDDVVVKAELPGMDKNDQVDDQLQTNVPSVYAAGRL